MKKPFLLIVIVAVAFVLSGCNGKIKLNIGNEEKALLLLSMNNPSLDELNFTGNVNNVYYDNNEANILDIDFNAYYTKTLSFINFDLSYQGPRGDLEYDASLYVVNNEVYINNINEPIKVLTKDFNLKAYLTIFKDLMNINYLTSGLMQYSSVYTNGSTYEFIFKIPEDALNGFNNQGYLRFELTYYKSKLDSIEIKTDLSVNSKVYSLDVYLELLDVKPQLPTATQLQDYQKIELLDLY